MNWDSIRKGELKEIFDAVQDSCSVLGIDYYLIGAVARNIWYAREKKPFRETRDVDFAVFVGNIMQYEGIRQYLKEHRGFQDTKENAFVLRTSSGLQLDILPFGGIEIDGEITVAGIGLISIGVNGFMEVYTEGTESIELETDHPFEVATLPSIVLLKLISFDDRPEIREKDARDIGNLIQHYFDLQANFIYEHYSNLFSIEDDLLAQQSLQEIAAHVIGQEIKKIIQHNPVLQRRIKRIIKHFVTEKDQSPFVRGMVNETGQPVSEIIKWLHKMHIGLE